MPMGIAGDVHDHALFSVLFLFRQRLRFVWDLSAFYDPLSPLPSVIRTHNVRMRAGLRIVVLNVYIGGHQSLPNSVQVGFTIRSMRRSIRRELPGDWSLGHGGRGLSGHRPDRHQEKRGPDSRNKPDQQT
jgi:hypothetical protein